jgi:predicted aldo/keto reductase-like oxidoreductase
MKTNHSSSSRRHFLKTALTVPAGLALAHNLPVQAATTESSTPAPAASLAPVKILPTRPLGKDGTQVTMVSLGGMMSAYSPDYLDIAWSMGIRYFDTARSYLNGRSETIVGQWLAKYPERRKEIFLVTKDHPNKGPEQLLELIEQRLAACGTKYLDAFYIHGIGPRDYGDESLAWPKSDKFKKVAEQLKSSGKVKKVGFSCHDGRLTDYLNAAAEGGFVDVIMMAFNPFYEKGGAFDKALDACHKAGIGLVAMKTMRNVSDVPKRVPEFDKLGLTVHQAKLQAVWSDPRISAVCNNIENVNQMDASTSAARKYKEPLKTAHMELLRQTILAHRRTMCPGCPACAAIAANTELAFHDIARFVMYYEQDGDVEAGDHYRALPVAARDASGVDLAALRDNCAFRIDYADVLKRAERYFA